MQKHSDWLDAKPDLDLAQQCMVGCLLSTAIFSRLHVMSDN